MNTEELAGLLAIPKLPGYLSQIEKHLQTVLNNAHPELSRPARRLLGSGGKRLRPALVLAAARMGGPINQAAVTAASAVELVHLASLIHDDIIDSSELRREVPTISGQEGLATAILVGDYLLAAGLGQAAAVSQAAGRELAAAILDLCDGQALELSGHYRRDPADITYIEAGREKTGALLRASCRIGGLCGGLPKAEIEALGKYGESFGIAFQIIDDIADNDLAESSLAKAVSQVKYYSDKAADALAGIIDRPVAAGLAQLPGIYLH